MSTELNELEKQYQEASKAYALGEPIMSDYQFDELESKLKELGSPLVNLVSEDFVGEIEEREVSYESFSIRSPKTWAEVRDFFAAFPNNSFVATLKMDGICTKLDIDRTSMVGQSRNRNARVPLDFTDAVNIAIPRPKVLGNVKVTGEAYLPWEDLDYFREKYDKDKYVMPRSAAISLLRTPHEHDVEDVKKLKFKAFSTDKKTADYEATLQWLESKGFEIPKYVVFTIDLSKDIEEQLTPIMELIDTGDPSDGMVIQVNEYDAKPTINGKYMSTQIAVKLGRWAGLLYEAEAIGLNFTKAKGNKGCTIQIVPFVTEDNCTINKVNAYNIGIVRRNKIKRGTVIKFHRISNNMCNLIYN